MDAIDGIREALGVDVLTSNLAALEAVDRWAGTSSPNLHEA
jgi:hypothetical protein